MSGYLADDIHIHPGKIHQRRSGTSGGVAVNQLIFLEGGGSQLASGSGAYFHRIINPRQLAYFLEIAVQLLVRDMRQLIRILVQNCTKRR